ncbi:MULTISPECIES: divalent-cation tolerance protein CutA [Providencia]|uniref:Divalent-cation tolerance protein CutA n=1 Tax=Providencia rettgeri TaxID=587 RepID=A0A3R8XUB5_PRORE|nr:MULTISPECIES: divalent-cation tolerance protein CutA [Providencia]ELR5072684.1 divalent-cation tolerance protein CutA [Providencia stuartii]ELR5069839.1 divalent-cation tolerance protein CutA [Providencia rettgeri]ELR5216160.1 divalent-cation tolerance protein CutA [Providencia rettgeri]ELR5221172.1 divalent-cation tolerance protein CutA [Providencia rettgeri]MBV2191325.1 divalent-cation tolerance protein CutA [Providencia rettgeri]
MSTNEIYTTNAKSPCIVLCTTNSHENAIKITQHLLANRLAACVSLLPEITSVYLWHDNITQDKEILLLIKTTQGNQLNLFKAIKEIHPYETPELIRLDPSQVEDNYLRWLISSVK